MLGPIFLKTVSGFVVKSCALDPGSNALVWHGDDGSSGTINLLNVTEIVLPSKNAGLRIHLVMSDGTTEKLLAGSIEAREQWICHIQSVCRENWSNIEIAAIASRFGFSTSFVQFCCLWFKSYHGDGSLSTLDVAKIMRDISSNRDQIAVSFDAFLDRHFSPNAPLPVSSATGLVPMRFIFEWISQLRELGHFGIAELCTLHAADTMTLEQAIKALHNSCSFVSSGDSSWLCSLLNVREACRQSNEQEIASAAGDGILFAILLQLLKDHSAATGSMLSVFVSVVALDCLQYIFSLATSASSCHGQVLATVARLSICGAFYSSSALDIMSLCVAGTARTRSKCLNALSSAAEASGKTLCCALVDSFLSGLSCCILSVLIFCNSCLKSAPTAADRELFAQSLHHSGMVTAVDTIRGSSSSNDVHFQLKLFDEYMSKIPINASMQSQTLPHEINLTSNSRKFRSCGVLLQSLLTRLEKSDADGVKMFEDHLNLWLKLNESKYFLTLSLMNKSLEHVVLGTPIPAETLSALKAMHKLRVQAGTGSRSTNPHEVTSESDSVAQSVVDTFWEFGSSLFGKDADTDEILLKNVDEHEKLKREHAAALQEIQLLRQSIAACNRDTKGFMVQSSSNHHTQTNYSTESFSRPTLPLNVVSPPSTPKLSSARLAVSSDASLFPNSSHVSSANLRKLYVALMSKERPLNHLALQVMRCIFYPFYCILLIFCLMPPYASPWLSASMKTAFGKAFKKLKQFWTKSSSERCLR
jgi:hypothetical protein